MIGRFSLAALFLSTVALTASPAEETKSYPAHVLIIRHAEKPPADAASPDLSDEGKARADLLPKLFVKADNRPDPFPAPDYLFAARNSKNSHRPTETVGPLAKALGLKVDESVKDADYAKLAEELFHDPKYAGKTVFICWHHGKIPKLASALGAADAPGEWDDKEFDRVWQIDYDKAGKATFRNLPQRLSPMDSEK